MIKIAQEKSRLGNYFHDLRSKIKLRLRYFIVNNFSYFIPHSHGIILTRTACLGNELARRVTVGIQLNHQKNRVDICIDQTRTYGLTSSTLLRRKDIFRLIGQQSFDFFSYKNVKLILIDSYSELTDQLFFSGNDHYFCANYSDVDNQKLSQSGGVCFGLMNEELIYDSYKKFFHLLFQSYTVPVIFLHFPTYLDHRDTFKNRAGIIKECICRLMLEYPLIYSIAVDNKYVLPAEGDFFPYHFSQKTYAQFEKLIRELDILSK